jgi:hypothetical protein
MNLKLPTILPAAAIGMLGPCEVGAPSKVLMRPFLPWIKAIAVQVARAAERPKTKAITSGRITALFRMDDLKFVRSRNPVWYSKDYLGMAGCDQLGWIFPDIREIYDSLGDEGGERDKMLDRENGQFTGKVRPVLFTDCMALLKSFNPRIWADKMERIVSTSMTMFLPTNMLWAQILLLDVTIHYLVRGGFQERKMYDGYEMWTPPVVAVITAVVDSWDGATVSVPAAGNDDPAEDGSLPKSTELPSKPPVTAPAQAPHPGTTSPPESSSTSTQAVQTAQAWSWDLLGSLRRQPALFAEKEGEKETDTDREEKLEMLAVLLQLRALFHFALLMLMPDSSDVYKAGSSDVEMYIT